MSGFVHGRTRLDHQRHRPFSKEAYSVPTGSRTVAALASAFRSALDKAGRRKLQAVRTEKGREFVTALLRNLLDYEGIKGEVVAETRCEHFYLNRTIKL